MRNSNYSGVKLKHECFNHFVNQQQEQIIAYKKEVAFAGSLQAGIELPLFLGAANLAVF